MLAEAVEADPRRPGGKCPVAVLVSGGIPSGSDSGVPPLEPDDREWLACACSPGSPEVLARIYRVLTAQGYRLGQTALPRHRRRDCCCR